MKMKLPLLCLPVASISHRRPECSLLDFSTKRVVELGTEPARIRLGFVTSRDLSALRGHLNQQATSNELSEIQTIC